MPKNQGNGSMHLSLWREYTSHSATEDTEITEFFLRRCSVVSVSSVAEEHTTIILSHDLWRIIR